jgi:hypothetical protein
VAVGILWIIREWRPSTAAKRGSTADEAADAIAISGAVSGVDATATKHKTAIATASGERDARNGSPPTTAHASSASHSNPASADLDATPKAITTSSS